MRANGMQKVLARGGSGVYHESGGFDRGKHVADVAVGWEAYGDANFRRPKWLAPPSPKRGLPGPGRR